MNYFGNVKKSRTPRTIENSAFYKKKVRKAIKEHMCCECYGTIECGEKYEIVSGIMNARAFEIKTCLDCVSLRADFCEEYDEIDYGGLQEVLFYSGSGDAKQMKEYIDI